MSDPLPVEFALSRRRRTLAMGRGSRDSGLITGLDGGLVTSLGGGLITSLGGEGLEEAGEGFF